MVWLTLAFGLIVLVIGADWLVRGAARLAATFGVPPLVIGLTVVAFGTSAPELAVSVKSAFAGQTELAVANVVGSNIFNVLVILGLSALIAPLVISHQLIRQDVPVMIAVSVVLVLMTLDGGLERWEAGVLLAGLILYTLFLFWQGRRQAAADPAAVADDEVSELIGSDSPAWKNIALVVAGLACLVQGGQWMVESAVDIATMFGVSEAVIGLTIVAAGTSLPEVMTSLMATFRGQRDIAVGNVVGSNTFNILCVLGVSGVIAPESLTLSDQLAGIDMPVMMAVALLCLPLFFTGSVLSRSEGVLFVLLYLSYLAYMLAVAIGSPHTADLVNVIVYALIPAALLFVCGSLIRDLRKRVSVRG